eukprot:scaffold1522_cov340-Prasinococcus_capsulatus_cf.AAC.24
MGFWHSRWISSMACNTSSDSGAASSRNGSQFSRSCSNVVAPMITLVEYARDWHHASARYVRDTPGSYDQ